MSILSFITVKSLIFLPEAYLAITLFIILFYGIFQKVAVGESGEEVKFLNRFFYIGISLIVFTLFLVIAISIFTIESTKGFFNVNIVIFVIKIIVLISIILIMIVSQKYLLRGYVIGSEYIIILLFSALGLCLLSSSNDLISMFISIEFSSLLFYLLSIHRRYTLTHNSALLKYFILSLVSSAIMLYGITFIYGFTSNTNFSYIASFLEQQDSNNILLIFAVLLVIVGLAFKIGLAPFHLWFIDVCSGLNYFLILLLNTVFKLVFVFILLKLLWGPFYSLSSHWWYIIYILSVLSCVVGYVGAIFQTNIMKILGYSSISQMGLASIFLLSNNDLSINFFILYFIVYIISSIGIFAILMWSNLNYKKLSNLEDLKGFAEKNPFYAFILSVFFLSLAGVPPLGGFFAKLFVFYSAIIANYYILSVIVIIITLIGMFFYIRIVRYIYMPSVIKDIIKPKKTRFISIYNFIIILCFLVILLFMIILILLNNILGGISILNVWN